MLKIEKDKRLCQVHLVLTNQKGWWNKNVLFALVLALGLHAFAFILFHIAPFRLKTAWTFGPIAANTEQSFLLNDDIAFDLFDLANFSSKMIEPPLSMPAFFTLDPLLSKEPILPYFSRELQAPLPDLGNWLETFSIDSAENFIASVQIYGPLSQTNLVGNDELTRLNSQDQQSDWGEYEVEVFGPTGKIIWWQASHPLRSVHQKAAENALQSLQFEPSPSRLFSKGTIEFFFKTPLLAQTSYD